MEEEEPVSVAGHGVHQVAEVLGEGLEQPF